MGFILKLLIFIICVYLLLKWIVKPLLRISFDRMIKTMVNRHMHEQSKYQRHNEKPNKREGSINVDYIPEDYKKKGNSEPRVGEYVDYEDVK